MQTKSEIDTKREHAEIIARLVEVIRERTPGQGRFCADCAEAMATVVLNYSTLHLRESAWTPTHVSRDGTETIKVVHRVNVPGRFPTVIFQLANGNYSDRSWDNFNEHFAPISVAGAQE